MAGQTQSEIRALLAGAGLAPRHRFGQNFLIDLNLMRKMVRAAEVRAADVVLEVGPGTGSLTELLLDTGARVVAVEIDTGLQQLLQSRIGDNPRFTLLAGDVLAGKHRINPVALNALQDHPPDAGGAYKLVANLPYQVATPLLMELLDITPAFGLLDATIQKEVAERFTAHPRTDAYGPVSVIAQTLAQIETVANLPPSVFWPQPQVESVMLVFRPRLPSEIDVSDVPAFVEFVRNGFAHRRQMMRRIVTRWNQPAAITALEQAGIDPNSRPQDLEPALWRRFFRLASTHPHE